MDFLTQFLTLLSNILKAYLEQTAATGRRSPELDASAQLLDRLERLLKPMLVKGASELPKLTEEALNEAREIVKSGLALLAQYAAGQASDYLEDRSLSPALAAAAGSRLYKGLADLLAVVVAQEKWLDERFSRSLLDWARRRNTRPVGPADIDIKLLQLGIALRVTESDAERALRDLNQMRDPLRYLLPGIEQPRSQGAAPLLSPSDHAPSAVTGPKVTLQTSAPKLTIKVAQQAYSELIGLVKEHVTSIMSDLQKATASGGGIDPQTVRIALGATLYLCVLGLRLVASQRAAIAGYDPNTVDADSDRSGSLW